MTAFECDLAKTAANYEALSPLSFLPRAAAVHPARTALVHGPQRFTWAEAYGRCRRLASALTRRGIGRGETVAVLAPNTPPLWEAHQGVPAAGAVLNALNTRLDAKTIAFILEHGEAKLLIADSEFASLVRQALASIEREIPVIEIHDPLAQGGEASDLHDLGAEDYEDFLAKGDPAFPWRLPEDEWQAISLNYTSGTTGNPKGVVYHHRGAYLNALGNIQVWEMGTHPRYLWTLPMFHCNGWCFPWTVTALGGTHVCLRRVEAAETIYGSASPKHRGDASLRCADRDADDRSTPPRRTNAAPFAQQSGRFDDRRRTASRQPSSRRSKAQGIEVTHVYGLTEVYGPAVVCGLAR